MEKKVSVIIPAYNRLKPLKKCLASLEKQTLPAEQFEVIVVDDGSTDGTDKFLEMFKEASNLDFRFYLQKNSGASVARNNGIQKSKTELIVFIDDDCVATPELLEDYLHALPDDPYCAGIGGAVENIDKRKHKAFFSIINANRHPEAGSHGQVPYLITANALYRKRCLLDVGGFDNRFHGVGGEDPDLSQRIIERGYYLKVIQNAKVYHHDRVSIRRIYKTFKFYGKGDRFRAELKNLPLEHKNRQIRNFEFKQLRNKYTHLTAYSAFTKWYWMLLQMAMHRGYNKGYSLPTKKVNKYDLPALPEENPIPPAISVIIPCYNDGRFLPEAVQSVERFPDKRVYEIIIIDDGSDDEETVEVIREMEQKGYRIIRPGWVGKCRARNLGIAEAKGRYILTLDADNIIEWDYIRKALYFLNNHPEIGVIYGNHYRFGEEERYVPVMGFDIRLMLVKNYIDTCAIFRKSAWESVGGFDEDMTDWEDWNLWLGMHRNGWQFHCINEPMFHYRIKPNSEGKKANLPENKTRAQKYMCAKYDDLYKKELEEMYEELKQIHNSKFIKLRNFLKLPAQYYRLLFPKRTVE